MMMRFNNLPLIAILLTVCDHLFIHVNGNRHHPRGGRVGKRNPTATVAAAAAVRSSSTSGEGGDDVVVRPSRRTRRFLKAEGKGKGKGSTSSGDGEESFEFIVEEDSNDGSFLVTLCDLFDSYAGRDCTVDGQVFEQALLCPDDYENSKICDALTHNTASTRIEAVTQEYCEPLFMGWNVNRPDDATINACIGSCVDFLDEDDECCVVPC